MLYCHILGLLQIINIYIIITFLHQSLLRKVFAAKMFYFFAPHEGLQSSFCSLLAIGLHHFGHLPNKFKFIKELLLPTKTENQMLVRVRNLKRNRNGAEHESAVRVRTSFLDWMI